MPTVPEYSRQVNSITALRPARANPSDLAAPGQQIARLGESLAKAGVSLGDVLQKKQEQENVDAVMQAESKLKTWESEYHYSIRERRGRNAEGITKETVKAWDKQAQEIGGSLQNEAQRRAFNRILLERRAASLDFVSRHQAAELREARIQGAEADIEATIQAGIANPGAAGLNEQTISRVYHALGKTEGLDPDYVTNKIRAATTAMHKGAIGAMVETDPLAAKAYYAAHKDAITPVERKSIEDALRRGGLKEFSQRKSDELVSKYGENFGAALADARAHIKDPERRDATVARIKARYAEFTTLKRDREKGAYEKALGLAIRGEIGSIDDIPQEVMTDLNPTDLMRIKSYLDKKAEAAIKPPSVDDPKVLYEAQDLIEQGEIYDEKQLRQYDPFLTNQGRRMLRTMLAKQNDISAAAVRQEFETRIGKTRAKFLASEEDRKLWEAFQTYIYDRIKGPARPQDLQTLADDFFLKVYRPGSGIAGFFRDTTTLGEAQVSGKGQEFVAEIPETDKGRLDQSLTTLKGVGVQVPETKTEKGAYYVQTYLPAVRHLQRMKVAVTGDTVAAYLIMKANKIKITPETIGTVVERMHRAQ